MNTNKRLITFVVIAASIALFTFVSKQSKQTGNNTIAASPTPVKRAIDCSAESIDRFNKNDRKISSLQVNGGQIFWKKGKYNWMVFQCPDESQSYTNVFMLTDKNNKVLLTMEDERFDKTELRDINRDGLPELIISHSNSGNCFNCSGETVLQINNGAVKDLFPDLPKIDGAKYSNVWLKDVNNDGTEEILATDDSWENHDGFFHYNAPQRVVVLSWIDGEYLDNGIAFSKYYQNKIQDNNKTIKELSGNKDTTLNSIVSLAVENYWNYEEINQPELGWTTFQKQIDPASIPKTIKISDEEKTWLQGIKQEIEEEYKASKPTPTYSKFFPM